MTERRTHRQDAAADLRLEDDPYLVECARWRAALAPPPRRSGSRRAAGHRVADWLLAVAIGIILAALAVRWAS